MLWFKRALGLLLVLVLALGTLVFVLENQQSLALSYLGFSTPVLPVALYVVAAFVAGGIIGLFLGMAMVSRLKYRLKAAETQLARKTQDPA